MVTKRRAGISRPFYWRRFGGSLNVPAGNEIHLKGRRLEHPELPPLPRRTRRQGNTFQPQSELGDIATEVLKPDPDAVGLRGHVNHARLATKGKLELVIALGQMDQTQNQPAAILVHLGLPFLSGKRRVVLRRYKAHKQPPEKAKMLSPFTSSPPSIQSTVKKRGKRAN